MRLLIAIITICLVAIAAPARDVVTDTCGVITRITPSEKVIYLVFTGHYSVADSGRFENFDGIDLVLETLKRKGVKGSFFPTAITLDQPKYEASVRRIIADGHYLSAHSYAHLRLVDDNKNTLVTSRQVEDDLLLQERTLARFGLEKEQFSTMIPPYEWYNTETASFYTRCGYTLIAPTLGLLTGEDWTYPGTKRYISARDIIDHLLHYERKHSLNGYIVLIHAMDYPHRTPDDRPYRYLGSIIDFLRARGYTFSKITPLSDK